MTVNKLIANLRVMQKAGLGEVECHMRAHDNSDGESQGHVTSVSHYIKDAADREIADHSLFDSTPDEMVYLHG